MLRETNPMGDMLTSSQKNKNALALPFTHLLFHISFFYLFFLCFSLHSLHTHPSPQGQAQTHCASFFMKFNLSSIPCSFTSSITLTMYSTALGSTQQASGSTIDPLWDKWCLLLSHLTMTQVLFFFFSSSPSNEE